MKEVHWRVTTWILWLVIAMILLVIAFTFLTDDIDHMIPMGFVYGR